MRIGFFTVACFCTLVGAQVNANEVPLLFEGFNSGFSPPWSEESWGRNIWGVTRSEIRPAGDGGTTATEGDGFCMMNVAAKSNGAPKPFCCHYVDLGDITEAGVTYSFAGDFGWRNASREGGQADYSFKPNKTGFKVGVDGQVFGNAYLFNFAERTDGEHRFTQYSFAYTTVEQDIGKPIQLALTLQGEDAAGSIELLTDNWKVTFAGTAGATLQQQRRDGPEEKPSHLGLLLN